MNQTDVAENKIYLLWRHQNGIDFYLKNLSGEKDAGGERVTPFYLA